MIKIAGLPDVSNWVFYRGNTFLIGLSESDGKSAAQLLRSKKSAPQREIIVFNPNAKREQYIKTAKRNRDLMGRHKRIKIVDPGVKFIID
jgi:hypothetical protein